MPTAAVLGTGLIGASVGLALRAAGWRVVGWDPDGAALAAARSFGAVEVAVPLEEAAVAEADLVVLAGPVAGTLETIARLETDALVTDVAGVKRPIVEAARRLPRFVGGHPMAGREVAGPQGASGSLFLGASWVLTADGVGGSDLGEMQELVSRFGAIPVVMSAEAHDTAVALVSHIPHLVAGSLVAAAAGSAEAMDLAAGGFRDLTRVAMSDPGWWVDVLLANRPAVSASLRALADDLAAVAAMVEAGDAAELRDRLAYSRLVRAGMAAPAAAVGVIVEDRPGEIARVGHSLSESGVDLRDLQLRHATHGGGGVLTLSVRAGEADALRAALVADGFRLVDTI